MDGIQHVLMLRRVHKEFGNIVAVDDVSLDLDARQAVGIVGESGCGKSTLGKAVLRLVKPDSGEILFHGKPVHNLTERQYRPFRSHIQMLFQNPLSSFNPLLTIGSSIKEYSNLNPDLKDKNVLTERVRYELDRVGLPIDRVISSKPSNLSGGQLQRAALARVLIVEPQVLVLDEPTSALDMSTRGQIVSLLQLIREQLPISYLIISHDLRVIRTITDRVLVMYLGEIVEECDKHTLFSAPLHPYTRALLVAAFGGGFSRIKDELKGEVTSADKLIRGCKLAKRCQYAEERCFLESQTLLPIRRGHKTRCWKAGQLE